MKRRLH